MRTLCFLLLLSAPAWATLRRVPSEYATIQAAFDAVQDHDTVLVALGVYSEMLTAPARPFVLKGEVIPDTGNYPRPIIDPSSLPGSDSLRCMTLPIGCDPVIEDMGFRNGPQMYPHQRGGGVNVECTRALVRRCVFDSTFWSLASTGNPCTLRVEQSLFLNAVGGVVGVSATPVFVMDCMFRLTHNPAQLSAAPDIRGGGGTQVQRCVFDGNTYGARCDLRRRNLLIQDCVFGPHFPPPALNPGDPVIFFDDNPSGIVENCVFQGLRPTTNGLVQFSCTCNDTDSIVFRHNRIVNNVVTENQGHNSVRFASFNGQGGRCNGRAEDNLFEGNHGNALNSKGLLLEGDAVAVGNRFRHLWMDITPFLLPAPAVGISTAGCVLARNRFDSTGTAVWAHLPVDSTDARGNWWGDPTGPFHPEFNPLGRGDTVYGPVDISDWCIDTSCTTTDAVSPFIFHPSSFILSAYPNPFNSTTVIRLQVPQAEIVRVELFDVLGRRVKELWSGVVAEEKEIAFDGNALASGVYFARVTNTIWNRPLVTTKLVLLQ